MKKEPWVTAALTNDRMVAELLIRMKQSSSLDSSHTPTTSTAIATATSLPPTGWGHRKSRSKPSSTFTTTTTTNNNNNIAGGCGGGFRKEQQSGSPTTPLCWSSGGVGGGASTSDGCDESSRPSDLSSGGRSTKGGAFGNDGATTSGYKKSRKRKSFAELKEEEDFLLKERLHLNRELESMRVTMNKQLATSQNLKKLKIDLHPNQEKEMEKRLIKSSCVVESNIEAQESGFVLPDLNMIPDEEQL